MSSRSTQRTLDSFIQTNSKKPKDPHAPKKPLSAYFLFCQQRRPELISLNPTMKLTEITKSLAKEWKALDDKSVYINLASDARMAYNLQMDEYKMTDNYQKYQTKLSQWKFTQENMKLSKDKQEEKDKDTNSKSTESKSNGSFSLKHVKGDLFSCPMSSSICHCVSYDLAMGKGIAKLFKQKFGGVKELKQQKKQIGECAILYRNGRYIYYMITKERYWMKPSYNDLRKTLEFMRDHAIKNDINQISMPRIGCGLDKLVWNKVEQIIKDIFNDTNVDITVYSL